MNRTLQLFLSLSLFVLAFSACEKEQVADDNTLVTEIILADDLQTVRPDQLPESSTKYVKDNYFDTFIEEVNMAPNRGYQVQLGLGENLYFTLDGEVIEYEGEVRLNGPLGGVHPHGPCFRLRRWLRGHGGQHDCDGDGEPDGPFAYAIDELSEEITSYIAENYPDAIIRRAAFRDDRFILLITGPTIVAFDGDGNFLREINPLAHCQRPCNGLEEGELSEAVAVYIAANFPDAEFRRACARGERTLVLLVNDDQRVFLGFDAEGNLIFQRP